MSVDISKLPPRQQQVARMRFEENMTLKQISVKLGWPFDEVSSHYYAALEKLRPSFEEATRQHRDANTSEVR